MSASKTRSLLDNLPAPLSSFIGRKQEIAEIKSLLATHRLVTLTGPGGCGKTRLALEVARELRAQFSGELCLVELAPLTAESLVAPAIASMLGLREKAGQPVKDVLVSNLETRTALLVLDNCEHLVSACAALVAGLLAACPHLCFLATSREPLGIPGEAIWVVPPLTLPRPQPWRSPSHPQERMKTYRESEAIQLFVTRAASASPGFQFTQESGLYIAEICRRLDGLPLAIELAAAHIRAFSAQQIAERLDDQFRLLSSRLRTNPARHQTLTATLDWSYELLSVEEKQLLARLAVFIDGWSLESAEAVCSGETIQPSAIMPLLFNLVDKSLVIVDDSGERRFRLLETIRQYALRKLTEAEKVTTIRDRHLTFFCRWAEMASEGLVGREQAEWLARFEAEHDNLRAALDWSQAAERAHDGLRLATACGYFWRLRGNLNEGQARLIDALSQKGSQKRDKVRAWALLWAAHLAYLQSSYDLTAKRAQEALEISRELGSDGMPGEARAYDLLGEVATEVGDYKRAPKHFEKALAIYRELGNRRGLADMLMQLAWAAMRLGNYSQAEPLFQECLVHYRALNEAFLLGIGLSGLGELAVRQGNYQDAERLLQESLDLRRQLGERWGIAVSLGSLAWVALYRRDFAHMRELLAESLEIRTDLGDQGGIAWCLEKAAEALVLESEAVPARYRGPVAKRAARLFGAASALRAARNSIIDPADRPLYEQRLDALRHTLDDSTFAEAWQEGAALPLDDVVALALSPGPTEASPAALFSDGDSKAPYGALSPRERETAVLIAAGKTNREIAELMVVREKTIETYVTRILNKLGFDSRVQIATWAVSTGLTQHNSDAGTEPGA